MIEIFGENMTLEERVNKLEAESDIRRLKARYLNACDRKDAVTVRACFAPDAVIDFPPLGQFDVDGLLGIFTQMAVSTNIIDSHHGHNAEITVNGDTAEATWNLGFTTINPDDGTFRLLSSFYTDRYEKRNGEWVFTYTKSEPTRIIDGTLNDTGLTANLLKDSA